MLCTTKKVAAAIAFIPAGLSLLLSCSGRHDVGSATLALTDTPGDVQCITVAVFGSTGARALFQFDPSSDDPADLSVEGLPIGVDVFYAEAFTADCGHIDVVDPDWVTDRVPAVIGSGHIARVSLHMRRNARAAVSISFDEGASADGGTSDASAICPPVCTFMPCSDSRNPSPCLCLPPDAPTPASADGRGVRSCPAPCDYPFVVVAGMAVKLPCDCFPDIMPGP